VNEVVVTMRDVRECGICVHGVKRWFDSKGLDFRHFCKHGMPVSQAEALDNAFVVKAIERARARAGAQE
jgi:hypothetical protein